MTLTVTRNGRWRLVGSIDEFANYLSGLAGYSASEVDPGDLKSMLATYIEGTSVRFKDHHSWWELKGSRSDLAELLGYTEARTVIETLEAFKRQHPNVRVLS